MIGVAKVLVTRGRRRMNGVHDMGGMHGMGAIRREEDEPAFHEPWEGRIFALTTAVEPGVDGPSMRPDTDRADAPGGLSAHELLREVARVASRTPVRERNGESAEIESGERADGTPKAIPPLPAAR